MNDIGGGGSYPGGLGTALMDNNYFVSGTNYGWGPPDSTNGGRIGDNTDTIHWQTWFRSANTSTFMTALFNESDQNSTFSRLSDDPGGENQIIMFKSCFPNSEVEDDISDEQAIYNDLLNYLRTRPDKLFVLITPPGEKNVASDDETKDLCDWLVNDWLTGYSASDGSQNVAVFDFYCVLSETNSHHRIVGDAIEHIYVDYDGKSPYHNGSDNHPNGTGNCKATTEFIPLLNYYYQRWQASRP